MIIGVVDSETTGFNRTTDEAVEVAIKLLDVETRTSIGSFSFIFPAASNPAVDINMIPEAALALECVQDAEMNLELLRIMIARCDVLVAHNAEFDAFFINKLFAKYGVDPGPVLWVCSLGINFPKGRSSRVLTHLAADHSVLVPGAHRAMIDAHMLESLLILVPDLMEQLKPKNKYQALVSIEEKDGAKALGFRWDPELRIWHRLLSESEAAEMAATAPFRITQVA